MTDRLDAIEAGLRDGRYDCRVPEDTDAVRWLVGEIKWMRDALGECYQLTGADPDGNENWRLAPHAIEEVRRLRDDHDNTESALTALRQLHAEAVEAGYVLAMRLVQSNLDRDDVERSACDHFFIHKWLARRGLAEKGGEHDE